MGFESNPPLSVGCSPEPYVPSSLTKLSTDQHDVYDDDDDDDDEYGDDVDMAMMIVTMIVMIIILI